MKFKTVKELVFSSEFVYWKQKYNQVKEFRETYGLPSFPCYNQENEILRDSLIKEETNEYIMSLDKHDYIGYYDGICDTVYVLLGSIETYENAELNEPYIINCISRWYRQLNSIMKHTLALKHFDKAFDEVHRSNMSKSCNSIDEVYATMSQPKYKDIKFKYVERNGKYFILIDEDVPERELKKGKLLKSINYSPANLEFVLEY
jgi:hypothetical protein